MIDSTTIKAHRTAASMRCDGEHRQVGRSVGPDYLKYTDRKYRKMPLDFCLTGGQVNDAKRRIPKLSNGINFRMGNICLLIRRMIRTRFGKTVPTYGTKTCIPPKCNTEFRPPKYDSELYKKRRIIENMFWAAKRLAGIAMRFCRCAHTFDSFVCLALIQIFFYVR